MKTFSDTQDLKNVTPMYSFSVQLLEYVLQQNDKVKQTRGTQETETKPRRKAKRIIRIMGEIILERLKKKNIAFQEEVLHGEKKQNQQIKGKNE